jgi:hypothetical protein
MVKRMCLILAAAVVLCVISSLNAEESISVSGMAVTPISVYAAQSPEELEENVVTAREQLERLITEDSQERIYQSMAELRELILVITERSRRVSIWEFEVVKEDANEYFDDTAAIIEDYLELIAHGGPVQNACARIGKTSLERADSFYLKAGTKKLDKYQKSYNRIGDIMKKQGERASEIWLTIEEERSDIETAFTMLKESKEYFNDLNETFGTEPAMNELKEVCDDLRELTEAALDIQNIVIGKTHAQNVSSCNKSAKQ